MKKKISVGRRNFLKMTAAGAAGLALANANKVFAAPAAWTTGMAINPNIDNMRVVSCHDTAMMNSTPVSMTFAAQNAAANTARIQANMDAMAMSLAQKTTAADAWSTIFQKPAAKTWSQVKAAIKVNTIEPKNMARIAVVQKFCNILLGYGVLPANIIIYDGNTTYAAGISNYTPYFSLTDSTKIQAAVSSYNSLMGGTINATVPGENTVACSANIANGTIDILINISNNKGHIYMGGATISMKNHFGTFAPSHTDTTNYVFNINKSDAIVGGTPPRQQLCFVDSLFANKVSNTGTPESMPCYLVMGVFGPAVDYLTVKQIREPVLGATHTESVIDSYVTAFGYATTDPVWVVVPPTASGISGPGSRENAGQSMDSFEVTLSNGRGPAASVRFSVPQNAGSFQVLITDMNGRTVRNLDVRSLKTDKTILWDGKSNGGGMVSPGNYSVKVRSGSFERTGKIIVS